MQSVSIFSRVNYTLALPINSPPGVQGERISTEETHEDFHTRKEATDAQERGLHRQRLLHDAPLHKNSETFIELLL